MRRNVRRKEDFLKRKSRYSQKDEPEQEDLYFKCDQCQNNFTTETYMKIHMETMHVEKEPMESIEQLDGHVEIQKTDDKESEIVRTAEQRKIHSDFIRKYVFSSVVDKFNYEMVCYKCNKNFTKKPDFKKHMQYDDHNKEIFINMT